MSTQNELLFLDREMKNKNKELDALLEERDQVLADLAELIIKARIKKPK